MDFKPKVAHIPIFDAPDGKMIMPHRVVTKEELIAEELIAMGYSSTDLPLDLGMARTSDPDTSHGAALKVLPRLSTDRQRVKECHEQHPEGLTDFRLAALLGGSQTSFGKRRLEIGCVDSGRREKAPSGARAIVWVLP